MDSLFEELKRLYLLLSAPAVALFAIAFFCADEPLVELQTRYLLLVSLYFIALIAVPISSYIFRRAIRKNLDLPDEKFIPIVRKNYRLRIFALNAISYLTSPIYFITLENGCVYLFAIISVVILLSYPTRQYVIQEK